MFAYIVLGHRGLPMARTDLEIVQLKLRFSEKLRARIEKAAGRHDRSMNAEIVHRLEKSFENEDQASLMEKTARDIASAIVREFVDGRRNEGRTTLAGRPTKSGSGDS
jgi:hypothetical protein